MKRPKRFRIKSVGGFVVLAAVVAGVSLVAYNRTMRRYGSITRGPVLRVVDGDTVVLKDGRRLRLLGVNTPEHGEAVADRARNFVRDFVAKGGLRLKDRGTHDYYHRLLGDLIRGTRSLCQALVDHGLAHVMLIPPYNRARADRLLAAQDRARARHLGIWNTPRYQHKLHITTFKTNQHKSIGKGYLRLANIAAVAVNTGGYFISNGKQMQRLPNCVIPRGESVIISTARGRNRCKRGRKLHINLGNPAFFGKGKARVIITKAGPGHEIIDKVLAKRL